jgi:poly-gamma-glutamate synthesis protein (capsule biosynthesis protein)
MGRAGAEALLAPAAPFLRSHDLALFNLECPASDLGEKAAKRFSFRGDPAALPALRASGLNVAGLANNHTLDCGREALLDTMRRLSEAGIEPVGAGRNEAEAPRAKVFSVRGVRVAVLAFLAMPVEGIVEAPDRPSVARASEDRVREAIGEARKEAHAVVAAFHWGREFDGSASNRQRALARLAVDSGADLVVGHHPHVLQGVEKYEGKLIVYSLGGFLFDLGRPEAKRTAALACEITREGIAQVRLVPFVVEGCSPRPAEGAEAAAILERIRFLSEEGGASLERSGDALLLR